MRDALIVAGTGGPGGAQVVPNTDRQTGHTAFPIDPGEPGPDPSSPEKSATAPGDALTGRRGHVS